VMGLQVSEDTGLSLQEPRSTMETEKPQCNMIDDKSLIQIVSVMTSGMTEYCGDRFSRHADSLPESPGAWLRLLTALSEVDRSSSSQIVISVRESFHGCVIQRRAHRPGWNRAWWPLEADWWGSRWWYVVSTKGPSLRSRCHATVY
jgi:hypothetical protein